ncbi:MAG TPA: hypothetical protein PLD20_19110 [Blastocatellia bacterium]|nr:hypothetical protein [Blastocatellia bacterium]HMV86424.1 hypothetical protein [Blastocatellia bacterium]HMX29054.1 hypothetical protein [Blastocatellia bacterium]HMZ20056.1 hypothetical protein [Blastocatellia bacterium]HNG33109.1 hypothetical protein [Blastocatellia bacterium]
MKLQTLSILPAHSTERAGGNSTAEELEHSSGEAASSSARYQAFLAQQALRTPRASLQPSAEVLSGLGRLLADVALFITFFFGFLTLFGFGLSRLSGRFDLSQSDVSASAQQADTPEPNLPTLPRKKPFNK